MIVREIEKFPSKLLVEGNDDQHVVWAICEKYHIAENFGIKDCTGIDKLLVEVPLRIKLRDQKLGILIDADTNLQARWQSLRNILIPLGYIVPNEPEPTGSIVYSNINSTVVGIWIMPDNQVGGMLEDFARILIPEEDIFISTAERIISEIEMGGAARFSNSHRSKALIHTWLAWQEAPGTPMGLALTKSYLNHNHRLCSLFVNWLNSLFNPILADN